MSALHERLSSLLTSKGGAIVMSAIRLAPQDWPSFGGASASVSLEVCGVDPDLLHAMSRLHGSSVAVVSRADLAALLDEVKALRAAAENAEQVSTKVEVPEQVLARMEERLTKIRFGLAGGEP